jgi:hypothetical protein
MDVVIVCHTEFGYVTDRTIIFSKMAKKGVTEGVKNLTSIANKYDAKITFAVMPEVAKYFQASDQHEIGLHIHPGWQQFRMGAHTWDVGDTYLLQHAAQKSKSTALNDYSFKSQIDLIKIGRECLQDTLGITPTTFVAGRWSENNNTLEALQRCGFLHDCSAVASRKENHYDWSRLPRICMPYHPSQNDYQVKGQSDLLIVPISQILRGGAINPELAPSIGLGSMKACFEEYYNQRMPVFHMCLHSPSMTDPYFSQILDKYVNFISNHADINFKKVSKISEELNYNKPKTNVLPYLIHVDGLVRRVSNIISTHCS